ncbi:MAG: cobalamin-dependent protein, partial [Desulfomonilaceae bacterium]
MKKILFVQLPPPRFIFEDPGANIPLASGFLASCVKTLAGEDFETEILGGDVVDVFADLGIIQEILQRSPDILALSLYLWNSQRSLFVAAAVKRLNSNIRVMVGGPEVTPDNTWVLTHPAVDLGVFGEGERQLLEVLKTIIYTYKKRRSLEALFHPGSKLFKSKKTLLKPWDLKHSKYPYVDGT